MYRPTSFSQLPEIVKNLLIINGLFFLAKITLPNGIDMDKLFALHPFQSADFKPYQIITHMFMHGNFTHLLFTANVQLFDYYIRFCVTCLTVSNLLKDRINLFVWNNQLSQLYQ